LSDAEYNLHESVAKLGRLVPIIKDAHGNIIDGEHRTQLDPKWAEEFSITLESIKDPTQRLLARMNINLIRRVVSAEEKTQWLRELAELTKWTPKEIAENSGMSYTWVMKYLPDEFKERPGAGPEEYPVTRRVTEPQEIRQPTLPAVPCSICPNNTIYPKDWHGNVVCPDCFEKLSRGEITLEPPKPRIEEAPKPPRLEKRIYEPGAWREEMHKPVSRMDEFVRNELIRLGYRIRSQEPVCIKSVVPEVIVDGKGDKSFEKPFAVFLDTVETHGKRTLVDMENRELLAKKGIRVLEIQYDSYTDEQRQLVMSEITSAL